MGNIIFIAVEILLLGAGLYFVPFFTLISITIFSLLYFYFGFKIKNFLYYLIPILFLTRILFSVNFYDFKSDDIINIKTNIINSKGKIEEINNKFPLENIYFSVENTPDGKYSFYGKLKKISDKYNFYNFEIIEKENIKQNGFEIFFDKRLAEIKNHVSNNCGNFLQGVILGERRYIHKNIRDKFTYCGTAHLLAISGLHIGIITGIILWILHFLSIKREIKYILGFLFLTIYILGITKSPSSVRAYIMGSIFILGKIFYEKTDIKKSLALAVIINFFISPISFGNLSFIFSYLCLFSIIYIFPICYIKKKKKYKNILNFLIFTGIIQIFITPVSIYFFKTIPLLSYFTNFILTPLGTIFIILGFISFFIPETILSIFFAPILQGIYNIIELTLNYLSKIPYLTIKYNGNLSLKFVIFTYIILIILFYLKKYLEKNNENSRERMCNWIWRKKI